MLNGRLSGHVRLCGGRGIGSARLAGESGGTLEGRSTYKGQEAELRTGLQWSPVRGLRLERLRRG